MKWRQKSLTDLKKKHSFNGDPKLPKWKRNPNSLKSHLLKRTLKFGDNYGESLNDPNYWSKLLMQETHISFTLKILKNIYLRLEKTDNTFYFSIKLTTWVKNSFNIGINFSKKEISSMFSSVQSRNLRKLKRKLKKKNCRKQNSQK